MKTTLNMMDAAQIKYSWETIYTALLHTLIEISEVEKYAIQLMGLNNFKNNELINDLAWGGNNREEILNAILNGKLVSNTNLFEKYELTKIKYSILFYLKEHFKDSKEQLLIKIAEVYADFGYPDDMSSFIYYMPISDNKIPDKETGEHDMILKFNIYIYKLKCIIEKNEIIF